MLSRAISAREAKFVVAKAMELTYVIYRDILQNVTRIVEAM
jgi:hypothetical protein